MIIKVISWFNQMSWGPAYLHRLIYKKTVNFIECPFFQKYCYINRINIYNNGPSIHNSFFAFRRGNPWLSLLLKHLLNVDVQFLELNLWLYYDLFEGVEVWLIPRLAYLVQKVLLLLVPIHNAQGRKLFEMDNLMGCLAFWWILRDFPINHIAG